VNHVKKAKTANVGEKAVTLTLQENLVTTKLILQKSLKPLKRLYFADYLNVVAQVEVMTMTLQDLATGLGLHARRMPPENQRT